MALRQMNQSMKSWRARVKGKELVEKINGESDIVKGEKRTQTLALVPVMSWMVQTLVCTIPPLILLKANTSNHSCYEKLLFRVIASDFELCINHSNQYCIYSDMTMHA